VCLGFGSLYNHDAENPNAVFDQDLSNRTISFYALRDIEVDDEIVINYNQRSSDKRKWWFELQPPASMNSSTEQNQPTVSLADN